MRLAATLILCLLSSSSFAQQCDHWEASMEEDEGGPRMMASICAQASDRGPEAKHFVLVECGPKDSLAISYLPSADASYPPGGNEEYKTKIAFSIGEKTVGLDAHYQAMDAAMVLDQGVDKQFVGLLMSQREMKLSDVNSDKVPVATFSLNGSKEALEKLIKTCAQQ